MEPVIIGTPSDCLSIQAVRRDRTGLVEEAWVRLSRQGLHAETWVWAHQRPGLDGLADYFAEMSDDWRGWDGERTWASVQGELQLTSRHEGGHIAIDVVLDREITWTVSTELAIEPGEQLTVAVRDLRELLG